MREPISDLTAAIDVGGTKIAGALFDEAGLVFRTERATPGPSGAADPGSTAMRALAGELAAAAAERKQSVTAVGLGCCEYVAEGLLTSTEVLAWSEQPGDWLPAVFPAASVQVESDVRCGLLAERTLGAGRGYDSVLFVSWGTGVSSALLVRGEIWPGARGRAIALGELPAPQGSTVERFCSGAGMVARWPTDGRATPSAQELLDRAAAGEPTAAAIANSAGQALADGLRTAVHLVDPAAIVLGGGLGSADTAARRALVEAWSTTPNSTPLVISELGPDGPLLGAALAAGWSVGATGRYGTDQR